MGGEKERRGCMAGQYIEDENEETSKRLIERNSTGAIRNG